MDKHGKQSQFGTIDNSVLARVTGGETLADIMDDSWGWYFASPSCKNAVRSAERDGWDAGGGLYSYKAGAWELGEEQGRRAWYGPACDYLGWF